jgi:hypothetical protein
VTNPTLTEEELAVRRPALPSLSRCMSFPALRYAVAKSVHCSARWFESMDTGAANGTQSLAGHSLALAGLRKSIQFLPPSGTNGVPLLESTCNLARTGPWSLHTAVA